MTPETLELFLKAVVIGFSIAAPVGPIAILCINRILSNGKLSGLASGMGAAAADLMYGALVAFGLTFISDFLTEYEIYMRLVGGLVLIALGIRTFLSKPPTQEAVLTVQSLFRDFISTLFLTLSNPLTIFAFFAALAGFNVHKIHATIFTPYIVMLGIFTGSMIWWTTLTYFVGFFYKAISSQKMKIINTFSGIVITMFGLGVLVELVLKFSNV